MIGTLEFTSAVYYRYAGLNLDLLAAPTHLGGLGQEDRKAIVEAFVRSTLLAVPGARRHSMNSDTLPGFVVGLYKDKGQPLQLVNAFLKPVRLASACVVMPHGHSAIFALGRRMIDSHSVFRV